MQDAFGRGLVVGNPITADSRAKKDESEYFLVIVCHVISVSSSYRIIDLFPRFRLICKRKRTRLATSYILYPQLRRSCHPATAFV
jgi:hypothetical protein